jgi:hypothetical protein
MGYRGLAGWGTGGCNDALCPDSYRDVDTHTDFYKHIYTNSNADTHSYVHFDTHSDTHSYVHFDTHSDSDANSQARRCAFDL